MKTAVVCHSISSSLIVGPEEDGGGKNALETFDDTAIMPSVFRQVREFEDFCRRLKPHDAVLLADCERGNPDRNQAVLPIGQSVMRMGNDVKEKLPVPPAMHLLGRRRAAERKAAENEWPRLEGKLLVAAGTFFSDKTDRIKLLHPVLGQADGGKNRPH